ncbi:unnamed protein product [Caenorhabditis sp. 36 PRJEB53466]|nr:unnamed protein product [Caenorhabditis sp. 36 PRJEB53466]
MYNFKSCVSGQNFLRAPSCGVCCEPFDDDKHLPKILQCAHTLCDFCVTVLEEQNRGNIGRLTTDRGYISVRCPTCRALTQVPRSFVRSNYQLMDLVESTRVETNHNISFLMCIECSGVYHERDVNVCNVCSPINGASRPLELLETGISLEKYALCSTCVLNKHMPQGHLFSSLQPLRVEMQRLENLRRIVSLQDTLYKSQKEFRDNMERTMENWLSWKEAHETGIGLFQAATNSFDQKKYFEQFVRLLTYKNEQVLKLTAQVEKWAAELESGVEAPVETATTPPVRPPRPPSPAAVVHENEDGFVPANYLYYFEHWDPQ